MLPNINHRYVNAQGQKEDLKCGERMGNASLDRNWENFTPCLVQLGLPNSNPDSDPWTDSLDWHLHAYTPVDTLL